MKCRNIFANQGYTPIFCISYANSYALLNSSSFSLIKVVWTLFCLFFGNLMLLWNAPRGDSLILGSLVRPGEVVQRSIWRSQADWLFLWRLVMAFWMKVRLSLRVDAPCSEDSYWIEPPRFIICVESKWGISSCEIFFCKSTCLLFLVGMDI